MHLIDTPSASGDSFVEGTIADDDWLDMLQEEPAAVAEWLGLRVPGPDAQLIESLRAHAHGIGFRNELINGDFQFWGRGSSFAGLTSLAHVAERWMFEPFDGEYDVERVPHPTNPRLRITTVDAAFKPRLSQRIEDVRRLAGAKVALSGWALADSASALAPHFLAVFRQHFGAFGSPDAVTSEESMGAIDADDTWTRFELETTVPLLGDVTIDGAGYTEIQLRIFGDYIVDITDVMLERARGAARLRFDRVPHAWDYRRASRYYQKSYLPLVDPGTASLAGALTGNYHLYTTGALVDHPRELSARFRVPMRATPTVTWYAPSTGTVGRIDVAAAEWPVDIGSTFGADPESTGSPNLTMTVGGGAGPDGAVPVAAHYTADAEL